MVKGSIRQGLFAVFAISIVSLMFISASCNLGNKEGGQASGQSYRTGTEGISLSFISNSPPSKVYTGMTGVPILIEVKNKGAYPSMGSGTTTSFEGNIVLSGFDASILKINSANGGSLLQSDGEGLTLSTTDLIGKSESYPQGGRQIVDYFKINSIDLYGGEKSKQTILATICYQYATIVDAQVCVDTDPYAITIKDKICTGRDTVLTSQGAPVAVTKIEQDVLKDRIQFTIHIKNVGTGRLIDTGSYGNCPYNLKYDDLNKITVHNGKAKLGVADLDCSPGLIYIAGTGKDAEGITVCTAKGLTPQQSAYYSNLHLEFDYAYQASAQTTMDIIKTPE